MTITTILSRACSLTLRNTVSAPTLYAKWLGRESFTVTKVAARALDTTGKCKTSSAKTDGAAELRIWWRGKKRDSLESRAEEV
jgi:hypothetical protein